MTLTFNGTSNYIPVFSAPELQLVKFTVAVSFKTSKNYATQGPGGEGILLMKGRWGVSGLSPGMRINYGMWVTDLNHLRAGFEEPNGTHHLVITHEDDTYVDGQWHTAIVTYDKVKVRLFIDGALYKRGDIYGAHVTSATPDNTGSVNIEIGRNPAHNHPIGGWFKGEMKNIRVYNRALAATEINNMPNDASLVLKLL